MNDKTEARLQQLRDDGYSVHTAWECEVKRELKRDNEMNLFYDGLEMVGPLDPREAFFGGRTEVFALKRDATGGDKILYADFTSLYPATLKYDKFMVSHPTVITEGFEPVDRRDMPYFGLIKCDVLPPPKLVYPVLPYRANSKLLFGLCRFAFCFTFSVCVSQHYLRDHTFQSEKKKFFQDLHGRTLPSFALPARRLSAHAAWYLDFH